MRTLIQRVTNASISVDGEIKGVIGKGLLVFACWEESDKEEDLQWMSSKVARLRVFDDPDGIMNLSVTDISGEILLISQFTLFASTKKGNRPSYIRSAKPDIAIPLYNKFIEMLETELGKTIQKGVFGADMKVSLINDGPVTIGIDSKQKE